MLAEALRVLVLISLAGFSATCLTLGVRSLGGELRVIRRMDALTVHPSARRILRDLGQACGRILIMGESDRREIEENLQLAGCYGANAPLAFAWLRLGATAAAWGLTAIALVATHRWSGAGPYLPWGAAGLAFILSKRALGWRAARRRKRVEIELPFVIDVLTMMLESGVSLDQCFRILSHPEGRGAPLIRGSLEALVADIERGMAYATALDRWSDRLGVAGARELAALFKRNLAHGAELSGALAAFAREFTERRVAAAREAVGRKSAQLAVVMMLFFLPALLVVLAGPAFVTLMNTLVGLAR